SRSALQTVLGFDLEGRVLRRRLEELRAAEAVAAAEPPPGPDVPEVEACKLRKASEKVAARLQRRLAETEALLAEVERRGGRDNVSVVVAYCGDGGRSGPATCVEK
ncbi:MAG: hypothetical protein VXW43_19965, partial [Pseudomonadota bacterium]|nr:hypothetical protein [Pseudomonadota bacterium]